MDKILQEDSDDRISRRRKELTFARSIDTNDPKKKAIKLQLEVNLEAFHAIEDSVLTIHKLQLQDEENGFTVEAKTKIMKRLKLAGNAIFSKNETLIVAYQRGWECADAFESGVVGLSDEARKGLKDAQKLLDLQSKQRRPAPYQFQPRNQQPYVRRPAANYGMQNQAYFPTGYSPTQFGQPFQGMQPALPYPPHQFGHPANMNSGPSTSGFARNSTNQPPPPGTSTSNTRGRCFSSNQFGHIASSCPNSN